jgi:AmmeMemoRadiSam system protein B
MEYSKLANAKKAYILNYSNSGDVSGDYESVVGYTSAVIK